MRDRTTVGLSNSIRSVWRLEGVDRGQLLAFRKRKKTLVTPCCVRFAEGFQVLKSDGTRFSQLIPRTPAEAGITKGSEDEIRAKPGMTSVPVRKQMNKNQPMMESRS